MSESGAVNIRVQEALAAWGAAKNAQTLAGALRECVTGELLLDATESTFADRERPFAPGDTLAIADQRDNSGQRLLLAYTSNDRLRLRRGGEPVSLVQPAASVIEMALQKYDGIAIDAGHDDVLIAYAAEIRQQLTDAPGDNTPVKQSLIERTGSFGDFVTLLRAAPVVFVPFVERRDDTGTVIGRVEMKATAADGAALTVAGTSPAELWAWAPDVGVQPTTFEHVARAALEDGNAGVLINPAGGSVVIPAGQLTPSE